MRRSTILAFLSCVHADILVDTVYTRGTLARFQVLFSVSHLNETIAGFAALDIYRYTNAFVANGIVGGPWRQVDSVRIPNSPLSIPFDNEVPTSGWTSGFASVHIGTSIASTITDEWGSFVLTPTSNTTGQLIISPQNASQYVFGGEFFYARNMHDVFWAVPVAIRIVESANSAAINSAGDIRTFEPCFLHSLGKHFFIPRRQFENFLDTLGDLRVPFIFSRDEDGVTRVALQNATEDQINSLPQIQFLLRSDNDEHINIAILHPREYIADDSSGAGRQEILIRTRRGSSCVVGPQILRKVVIHADARNSRIGFGEPIVEIDF